MRVASASSSRPSRVTSESLVSTVTADPSAAGPGRLVSGERQQVRVAVVEDPVLRPGQERGEPPAHRRRCRSRGRGSTRRPVAGRRGAKLRDELARPGRSVCALAQVEPGRADRDRLDGHRAASAMHARDDGDGGRPAGERLAPLARRPPQPPAQVGVLEPGSQRVAERRRIVRGNEQARPDAVGAVTQSLRHSADVGGDDRQAACQRLGDDHPVRLRARRQHEHIRRAVAAGELGSRLRAREAHPAVHPAGGDAAAQTFDEGSGRAPGCRRTGTASEGRSASRARRAARRGPCRV